MDEQKLNVEEVETETKSEKKKKLIPIIAVAGVGIVLVLIFIISSFGGSSGSSTSGTFGYGVKMGMSLEEVNALDPDTIVSELNLVSKSASMLNLSESGVYLDIAYVFSDDLELAQIMILVDTEDYKGSTGELELSVIDSISDFTGTSPKYNQASEASIWYTDTEIVTVNFGYSYSSYTMLIRIMALVD